MIAQHFEVSSLVDLTVYRKGNLQTLKSQRAHLRYQNIPFGKRTEDSDAAALFAVFEARLCAFCCLATEVGVNTLTKPPNSSISNTPKIRCWTCCHMAVSGGFQRRKPAVRGALGGIRVLLDTFLGDSIGCGENSATDQPRQLGLLLTS